MTMMDSMGQVTSNDNNNNNIYFYCTCSVLERYKY